MPPSFLPKNRARLLAIAPVAVLVLWVAKVSWSAYRFERGLAFVRQGLTGTAEGSGLAGALDVEYGRSEGAPLRGWYAPSKNGGAILFVHGAGGNRQSLAREAALLRADGFGVLLIDLPGQGESGGRITCGRTEEAAVQAAVEWLARQSASGREPLRIGGLAHSLGSQFLARTAASDPRLRAIVLEAASTSIIDRVRESHRQWGWLGALPATLAFFQEGTNPWATPARDAVAAIAPRPVLLISGRRDAMATPAMGQEMLRRAGAHGRLEVFDTGHSDYEQADEARYTGLLRSFFAAALSGGS